jgi:tRNA A37 N6-isopentenylltransferase MiaA
MRASGYREMFDVIEGNISIEETRVLIIIRTRQYAKRQSTWMRKYISQINSNVGC